MSKTLLKIYSVLLLVCTLLIGSSFSVYAYDSRVAVSVPYTTTEYGYWTDIEKYYKPEYFTITEYTSDLIAYINDMHTSGGGASSEDNMVDPSYPLFIVCSSTSTNTETGLSRSLYCFSIDDLSNYNFTDTTGANAVSNVMQLLIGTSVPNALSANAVSYGTIFDLGYRFYHKTTTTYGGSTYYLYTLARYKAPDTITFNNDLSGKGYEYGNVWEYSLYMHFKRFDFMPLAMRITSDNSLLRYESGIIELNLLANISGFAIYETNDLSIIDRGNYNSIQLAITGPNPYLTVVETHPSNYTGTFNPSYTSSTASGFYYALNTDMTGVNSKLTEIIDLLSDMQVEEINNYYIDLSSEWNIDIDEEINLHLGDFNVNVNDLPISDPKYMNNTTEFQKVGSFKIIFSNMMQTMDDSGIAVLYFLPFILLVLGAVL